MKRLAWIPLGLFLVFVMAACAPTPSVESNVLPTLISVTVPPSGNGPVVLQGRYFGDGQGGQAKNSYVIVGANINANGGMQVTPDLWTVSRIEFNVPDGAKSGFIYVVVGGVRSNGVPATLP